MTTKKKALSKKTKKPSPRKLGGVKSLDVIHNLRSYTDR
jgi:hypothetical protein